MAFVDSWERVWEGKKWMKIKTETYKILCSYFRISTAINKAFIWICKLQTFHNNKLNWK